MTMKSGFQAVHPSVATKQLRSMFDEFKNFAFKGSVVDMAVGVVIGAAFGKIVDSLVKNIIMPAIGLLMPGEQGYVDWKFAVGAKEIPYGLFLGEVVNFLIVAFALYIFMVKFIGLMLARKKDEQEQIPAAPAESEEEKLLKEIRDLLAARSK
jgi:large conductance mechanosensitive channel